MKASSILLVAAFAVTACNQTAKTDIGKEEAAIRAKETGWMEAYNKRDANALAAEYADDGAVANPGAALATDTVGRRKLLDGITADEALKLDFASDRVIV